MRKQLLFLLVFLIVSLFFPLFSIVNAQEETFFVTVQTSELYGLRGESVDILTFTNSSSFLQQILDPNGGILYNQTRTSNMTLTIPLDAVYGTYTIKSIVENDVATTWFTVLDVSNWNLASFPYKVSHNNVNYTFFGNWSVLAELEDDNLLIDLAKLREWKDAFNLDVTALKNSMNVLVRFSKAPYFALDLTFAFIHCGCKIVVNGTQDQARDFTFSFNAKNFKNWLYGIKGDHLIFDWSDIPKSAYDYNGENKLLTVHIPETFRVDPTIFEDGFESGNFSAWTGTSGTPTIVEDPVHHGSYAAQADAAYDYWYKDFSGQTVVYVRFYFRLSALISFELLDIRTSSSTIGYVNILSGGGIRYIYKNGTTDEYLPGFSGYPAGIQPNTWYCIEVKHTINGTNGEVEMWFNGTSVGSVSGKDTDNYGNITRVLMGRYYGSGTCIVTCDCVVFADAYIGVEGGAEEYERAATQGITVSSSTARLFEGVRSATQSLTFAFSTSRIIEVIRQATQTLTLTSSAVGFSGFFMDVSVAIGFSWSGTRLIEVSRQATQLLTFSFAASRIIEVIRAASQTLTFSWQATKQVISGVLREASLSLTLVFGNSRQIEVTRQATQQIILTLLNQRGIEVTRLATQALTFTWLGFGSIAGEYSRGASVVLSFVSGVMGTVGESLDLIFGVAVLGFIAGMIALALVASKRD